jgi:hypothetical protein
MIHRVIAGISALTAAFRDLGAAVESVRVPAASSARHPISDDALEDAIKRGRMPKTVEALRRRVDQR